MNSRVSLTRCESYDPFLVQDAVRRSLSLLGGISNFIRPKSKVLVKPNLLVAKEPESGIVTHPEVVRGVIKLLKEIGCEVFVGDGPSVWGAHAQNIDEVHSRAGMKRICEEENVRLVKFSKSFWKGDFPLTEWLRECDYFVSLPKLKTHELTLLTGAVKNIFGLISTNYKTELHRKFFEADKFAGMLVDLLTQARPALSIVDGIVAMEGDGPASSGKLRNEGLIVAGDDPVAIDSVLARLMGLKPLDILSTREAAARRLGEADINSIEVLGEKLEDVIKKPFQLPVSSLLRRKWPAFIIAIAKKIIKFYPELVHKECIDCGACIEACPNKIISRKNGRMAIDYSKCISCFCCQESCIAKAIKVKKSFFARLLGI
ncbi:MAG: DUF362 domain-containing protein [Candidatus Omnitrophota bacterium]